MSFRNRLINTQLQLGGPKPGVIVTVSPVFRAGHRLNQRATGCRQTAEAVKDDRLTPGTQLKLGVNESVQWLRGFNPERVVAPVVRMRETTWRHNPFRVGGSLGPFPRVARSSQPWAVRRNPFGIGARIASNLIIVLLGLLLSRFPLPAQDTPPAEVQRKPIVIAKIDRKTPIDFEKEILPILKNNCLACHNKTTTKAGLNLETPQDILKGGESGKVVVPKRSGDSLLLKIASHQVKPMMPPTNNKVQASDLAPEELGLIKLWIDQGAKGEVHGAGPIVWQPLPEGLNPIYAVALTADGQFAACARANQIFVYHVLSKQLVTRLTDSQLLKGGIYGKLGVAHRDLVHSLAFSPDGNLLASGGYREAKLWRRQKDVQKFNLSSIARQAVVAVAVSPDGKLLATSGDDGNIRLWNPATGKSIRNLSGHKRAVNGLNFSPDSSKLVSGSSDKTIRVWDLAKGKVLCQAQTATEVNAVTWIADGRQIASGGADYLIRVWYVDLAKRELAALKEIKGHEGPVRSLAGIPPNGAQFISGSGDGTIRQWNLEDGQLIRTMKHGGPVAAVAVRGDGKRFASAGLNNVAKLWDVAEGKEIAELRGDRYARELQVAKERELSFATNEVAYRKSAFQTATTNHNVQLDRIKKATETLAAAEKTCGEKRTNVLNAAEAKATAEKALAEFAEIKAATDAHEAAEKASTQAAAELKAAKEKTAPDTAVVEKLVADADAKAKTAADAKAVLDKLPAEAREKFKPANDKLTAAIKAMANAEAELKKAELPKSTAEHELQLATKAAAKTEENVAEAKAAIEAAEEFQTQSEKDLQTAKNAGTGSEKPIRMLAFSPDNLVLATAGDDQQIHTWNAESGTAIETFRGHKGPVFAVAFAGDKTLVSGAADRSAVAWDLNAGWTLERTIGTGDNSSPISGRVNAVRFSPDGKRLATGGGEATRGGDIRIWQVADGKLTQSFTNVHSDEVFGLDFSADGKYLASSAADKFVKVLDLATGKVVKTFEGHTHHVLGVSWKRDGRTLASAGADNVVKVWDFVTGERKKTIEGFGKEVTSISFIGITDQTLASSGDDQVRTVNENGEKIRSFEGGTNFVNAASITPDGRIVIAGGQDSVLRVWNGTNANVIATFAPPGAR
jgi:WD40 repeat protein